MTPESNRRLARARALLQTCPPRVGLEAAVTGSVSRGVADAFSDLELNFWVDEVPPADELQAWLRSRGVQVEPLIDALEDGSVWLRGWSGGVPIEAGWQPLAALETDLHGLLAADPPFLPRLVLAWTVQHAIPLVSAGRLAQWQAALHPYPEALRQHLVGEELRRRATPHGWPESVTNLWPLACRNERLDLQRALGAEIGRVLRVLFAHNRRWEPSMKWAHTEARHLAARPAALDERITGLLTTPDPREAVRACLALVQDTLELLVPDFEVGAPLQRVREAQDLAVLLRPPGEVG